MANRIQPFINQDLKITECNLYSQDKDYLKSLSKKQKNKKVVLDKLTIKEIYNVLENKNTKDVCFIIKMSKNNLTIDSQALHVYNANLEESKQSVLGAKKYYNVFYKYTDNPDKNFYDILLKSINQLKDLSIKPLQEYIKERKVVNCDKKYYLTFYFTSSKKFEIVLISYGSNDKINRKVYLGRKINESVSNSIYKLLLKWYEEDNK